jgi:hypothetical protein
MLTLKTYAHAMREEETDLSFAEFGPSAGPVPRRLRRRRRRGNPPTAQANLEHETGLEPATPTLAKRRIHSK